MTQCSTLAYTINRVDKSKPPVIVNRGDINNTSFDITLLGRRRLEYGETFNENMLHILENFSCPAQNPTAPINQQVPDTSVAISNLLQNPVDGQFWYNSSVDRIYYCRAEEIVVNGQSTVSAVWIPLEMDSDVAGNSGHIMDGQQIPRPVNVNGHIFEYSECSWVVAPAEHDDEIDYMVCTTDAQGVVEVKYRRVGSSELISGIASYQIIGIRDNTNLGSQD